MRYKSAFSCCRLSAKKNFSRGTGLSPPLVFFFEVFWYVFMHKMSLKTFLVLNRIIILKRITLLTDAVRWCTGEIGPCNGLCTSFDNDTKTSFVVLFRVNSRILRRKIIIGCKCNRFSEFNVVYLSDKTSIVYKWHQKMDLNSNYEWATLKTLQFQS